MINLSPKGKKGVGRGSSLDHLRPKGLVGFNTYPGISRIELMQSKAGIIKPRDPVLWNVEALKTMYGDIQDDVMEIFSPPRVAKKNT